MVMKKFLLMKILPPKTKKCSIMPTVSRNNTTGDMSGHQME